MHAMDQKNVSDSMVYTCRLLRLLFYFEVMKNVGQHAFAMRKKDN